MSTVKANSYYDASGGSSAQLYGVSMRNGGTGWVNRIINGDMRIDQRNAGASTTSAQGYTLDRFAVNSGGGGLFNVQRDTVAPAGFSNSLKVTVGTADSSLAVSDYGQLYQVVEGFNFADMAWGTTSAKTVTLSFWVRASVTGTYAGGLVNSAENRSYVFTYTISAANTWEYKTITIAGDTSGTWVTDNGKGVNVKWDLGSGSNYQNTAGSWAASHSFSTSASVKLSATNGATFYITGVQLEAGSVATPFERRPYGTELALCQRYFYRSGGSIAYQSHSIGVFTASNQVDGPFWFPVPFRATPSLTVNNLASFYSAGGGTPSSIVLQDAPSTNNNQLMLRWVVPTAFAVGNAARLYSNNNAAATLDFSAEL